MKDKRKQNGYSKGKGSAKRGRAPRSVQHATMERTNRVAQNKFRGCRLFPMCAQTYPMTIHGKPPNCGPLRRRRMWARCAANQAILKTQSGPPVPPHPPGMVTEPCRTPGRASRRRNRSKLRQRQPFRAQDVIRGGLQAKQMGRPRIGRDQSPELWQATPLDRSQIEARIAKRKIERRHMKRGVVKLLESNVRILSSSLAA